MSRAPSPLPSTMDNLEMSEKVKSRWTRSFFSAVDTRGHQQRHICDICHRGFASPSNLNLHRSTHVIERRYKCEPCQVSFHSQGHIQKHKRSSAHKTRVAMTQAFGMPTSDNPRPYGCPECDTAFRKHGHLAKHLRSKSHITKLEANGLIPTGTYAALEKSGQELKEKLVTTNCEKSLHSLRSIAMQLFKTSGDQTSDPSPELMTPSSSTLFYQGALSQVPALTQTSSPLSLSSRSTDSASSRLGLDMSNAQTLTGSRLGEQIFTSSPHLVRPMFSTQPEHTAQQTQILDCTLHVPSMQTSSLRSTPMTSTGVDGGHIRSCYQQQQQQPQPHLHQVQADDFHINHGHHPHLTLMTSYSGYAPATPIPPMSMVAGSQSPFGNPAILSQPSKLHETCSEQVKNPAFSFVQPPVPIANYALPISSAPTADYQEQYHLGAPAISFDIPQPYTNQSATMQHPGGAF